MRHTQIVRQDGLPQSGKKWNSVSSLSAFQPVYNELSHYKSVQTINHARSCLLPANVWTGEDENMGIQLTFDNTHCPDARRKLPRQKLIHRWLKQLTRQAPEHLSIDPTLKLPDTYRHCNDPTLPHKFSERCFYPRSEERPASLRLVLWTQRCSYRLVLPK